MEKNKAGKPCCFVINSLFLVYSGHMVRLRLLSKYTVALACTHEMGHFDMGPSYIKFLIDSLTGMNLDKKMVDIFSLLFLLLALSASALTNGIALRKTHQWTKTEV